MPSAPPQRAVWQASVRFDRSKARPWMGLRHAVGVALPAAVGVLAGRPGGGIIAATGALNVAVADGSDPYLYRSRRMGLAAVFCALAVFAAEVAGGNDAAAIPLLGAAAFAAGMMVAVSAAAADIALVVLVVLIVYSGHPAPFGEALSAGGAALAGGALQAALALAPALRPSHQRPERRALSALFFELARAAGSAPAAREAPLASREAAEAHQVLAAADGSMHAARYIALLSQAERMRLAITALARLRVRIARESGFEAATGALGRAAEAAGHGLRALASSLAGARPEPPVEELPRELDAAAETLRGLEGAGADGAAAMVRDARAQLEALAGQIRSAFEIASHTESPGLAEFERREAARPWRLRLGGTASTLRANLNLESAACRHGLRLAVCVAVGETLGRSFGVARGYWIPMTIALVLKPDYTTTFSRGVQRLAGTLAGLLAATALFHVTRPTAGVQVGFIFLFAFVLRAWGPANYAILSTAVTGLVVFMFAAIGLDPAGVMVARGWNTLAGGVIALIAYAAWPTWERTLAPDALAKLLEVYRAYLRVVRDGYLHQAVPAFALEQTRQAARLARFNVEASLARLRAETRDADELAERLSAAVAASHRFINAAMALEAGLLTSPPVPARAAFAKLTDDVDIALYYLERFLGGSPVDAGYLPDLREDHHALVHSGDSRVERYALVNIETDRIVNSVNTLAMEILDGRAGENGRGGREA